MSKIAFGQMRETAYETPAAASAPAACLNCGEALTGPFCSACGQRNIPPYPSVKELVVDAFWELSGWDGRFAGTVRALFRKPGMLTLEFLEGRRARYLSPLRLYLLASLVYFLLAAAARNVRPGAALDAGGLRVGVFTPGVPGDTVRITTDPDLKPATMTPEQKKAALESIADEPWWIKPTLQRAVEDPVGFQRALITAMPRMLFALLPVFAGILALFFRGRKYPEHLYFAVHLHAFIFLALSFSALAKFTGSLKVAFVVGIVVVLWIPIYTHVALRRVYAESQGRTVAKELGIGALYAVVSVPALMALLMWAARNT